jgi:hypothetical protein
MSLCVNADLDRSLDGRGASRALIRMLLCLVVHAVLKCLNEVDKDDLWLGAVHRRSRGVLLCSGLGSTSRISSSRVLPEDLTSNFDRKCTIHHATSYANLTTDPQTHKGINSLQVVLI